MSWPSGGEGQGFAAPGQQHRPGQQPVLGAVLQGTVKSYSAKGFGFILCPEIDHDVYFARESLEGGLRTANIAGTVVQFNLQRGMHGKPQAVALRPLDGQIAPSSYNRGYAAPPPNMAYQNQAPQGWGANFGQTGPGQFSQFGGCGAQVPGQGGLPPSQPGVPPGGVFGGQAFSPPAGMMMAPPAALGASFAAFRAQPAAPRRAISPHAGSRAMMGVPPKAAGAAPAEKKASASSSSEKSSEESDSSSSGKKKKKDKKKKGKKDRSRSRKRKKSSSEDSRQSIISSDDAKDKEAAGSGSVTEDQAAVETAKREVLQQMENLKKLEPKETRMKEWRSLLRSWHPDKNRDKTEVATAVFQFLQKGKRLLDL